MPDFYLLKKLNLGLRNKHFNDMNLKYQVLNYFPSNLYYLSTCISERFLKMNCNCKVLTDSIFIYVFSGKCLI